MILYIVLYTGSSFKPTWCLFFFSLLSITSCCFFLICISFHLSFFPSSVMQVQCSQNRLIRSQNWNLHIKVSMHKLSLQFVILLSYLGQDDISFFPKGYVQDACWMSSLLELFTWFLCCWGAKGEAIWRPNKGIKWICSNFIYSRPSYGQPTHKPAWCFISSGECCEIIRS